MFTLPDPRPAHRQIQRTVCFVVVVGLGSQDVNVGEFGIDSFGGRIPKSDERDERDERTAVFQYRG